MNKEEIIAAVKEHVTAQTKMLKSLADDLKDLYLNGKLSEEEIRDMLKGYQWLDKWDTGHYSNGEKEVGYYVIPKDPEKWPLPSKVCLVTIWE